MTSSHAGRRSIVDALMILLTFLVATAPCLNNGVGRTPPMGFNPFSGPLYMLTEQQYIMLGKAAVMNGMKAAGYIYVNNDVAGAGAGVLGENPLTPVMDSLHNMGLKGGVYMFPPRDKALDAAGCATWANKFKTWGVDYVKFDGWSGTPAVAFTAMRDALAATGRPIFYNANIDEGPRDGTICNSWRTSGDINIQDWNSWTGNLASNAGGDGKPGAWGDPDMMGIACGMPSEIEEQAMFSLWCVNSSPLFTSTDWRVMFESTHYILLNTEAIAVNQDTAFSTNPSYGGSGKRIKQSAGQEIWLKTVTGGPKAVVLFNTGSSAASISVNWTDIGIAAGEAQVRDLWEHKNLGAFTNSYTAQVPSHGAAFVKIVAGSTPIPEPAKTWFVKPADPIPVTPLSRTGWAASIDLQVNGDVNSVLDGNLGTTIFANPGNTTKNNLTIDMKTAQTFNCVIMSNGANKVGPAIKPYRVYQGTHLWELSVSDNGSTWKIVDSTWGGPINYQYFTFTAQTARYVRLSHSLVGVRLRNYEFAGDENQGNGFRGGGGIGEIYVANASTLPVKIRPAADPSLFAIAPKTVASPQRFVVMGHGRTSMIPSNPGSMDGSVFSIDGRALDAQNGQAPLRTNGMLFFTNRK